MQYIPPHKTSTIFITSPLHWPPTLTSTRWYWSVFANLQDSLHYLQTVSTHTIEYIDAATSGILSPHVLPVTDLQKMLQHIADTLPPTLHLPISPEDTLHFYRYLCTHVLIENSFYCWLTYPYKIEPTRSQCTRSSPWIFPTETIQPTMT